MSSSTSSSDPRHGVGRFLRRAALLSITLVAVLAGAQLALTTGLRHSRAGIRATWNAMSRGEVRADVLVVGSSRTEVGLDPKALGQALGGKGFNLSRSGTRPDLQLPFLREYLRKNPPPRLLIQGLDHTSLLLSPNLYNAGQYTPYLASPEIYQSVLRFDPKCRFDRTFPLFAIARHRLSAEGLRALLHLEGDDTKALGYFPRNREWQGGKTLFDLSGGPDDRSETETPEGRQALLDLLRFEKAAVQTMVAVYLPEYRDPAHANEPHPRHRVIAALRRLATEEGLTYLDYSDDPLCQDRSNFFDTIHLNTRGATRFSARLAEDLKKLLAVADRTQTAPSISSRP